MISSDWNRELELAEERWSLTMGGRTGKLNCIQIQIFGESSRREGFTVDTHNEIIRVNKKIKLSYRLLPP